MKIKLLLSIILLASTVCIAQVSIGKLEPNKSAQLEVVSSNKGLLIPKITLTSLSDVATITNGNIDGLTVFNTSSTADLKPGYYYWHTDRWNRLITKDDVMADIHPPSEFSKKGTVITNILDITDITDSSEDFVFGSTQLDDDPNTTEDNSRMFFDKSKGAFRAGTADGDKWNDGLYDHDNDDYLADDGDSSTTPTNHIERIGRSSVALGYNTIASGEGSVAIGYNSKAYRERSVAMGNYSHSKGYGSIALGGTAAGSNSIAIGSSYTEGTSSIAIGHSNYTEKQSSIAIGSYVNSVAKRSIGIGNKLDSNTYLGLVVGTYNQGATGTLSDSQFISTERLFTIGNGTDNVNRNNALVMLKNGNTTVYGNLSINSDGTLYSSANDVFTVDKTTGNTTIAGDLTVNGLGGNITPDYVFQKYYSGESSLKPSYKMPSLAEIEKFTRENNHLPGVPSAKQVKEAGGIVLNRSTEINLEKIEELFLHTIEQEKEIKKLRERLAKIEAALGI